MKQIGLKKGLSPLKKGGPENYTNDGGDIDISNQEEKETREKPGQRRRERPDETRTRVSCSREISQPTPLKVAGRCRKLSQPTPPQVTDDARR
ncbi:predicted protein [Arabidopsis lyrata subsp. lyrata]|uniref:Predicted protein n=1 Tax=Arabidopsis lyrata subsp. lyrata TaxID=81972 RepID=D7KM68_ARALL|nr:predicted protein [Arabidopsis lyrata subsp. lyrata]